IIYSRLAIGQNIVKLLLIRILHFNKRLRVYRILLQLVHTSLEHLITFPRLYWNII
ncbi:hypothetical protein PICMEDRAFT_71134, partial [Pichia membranifaciens NRRL Y-2026]